MALRQRAGVPIPAPPPAPTRARATAPLDVPLILQQQNQWCWAACAAMIARFLRLPEAGQCDLANFLFGQTGCCRNPAGPRCNRPAQYADIVRVYHHLAIAVVGPDLPLLPDTAAAELDAGRPFEVALAWAGGGGHVVIAYGYTQGGLILVRDPWYGSLSLRYDELYAAYGLGRWNASYGRFRRA